MTLKLSFLFRVSFLFTQSTNLLSSGSAVIRLKRYVGLISSMKPLSIRVLMTVSAKTGLKTLVSCIKGSRNKGVLPIQYGQPHVTVNAMSSHALQKAVGVKDTLPRMEIHLVNLVKTFLIKLTRVPHLLGEGIEFLCIIIADDSLNIIQFLIALNTREDIQQIELGRIENGGLCIHHNFSICSSTLQK